jgi:ubiquitin thioesterase OTU1
MGNSPTTHRRHRREKEQITRAQLREPRPQPRRQEAPAPPKKPTKISQVPDEFGLVMKRKAIISDNSCLFRAVGYAMERGCRDKANELRLLITQYILNNPQKYKPPLLELPAHDYCAWILDERNWGGAIELDILAQHYKTEICVIDIGSLITQVFGEGNKYSKRIYLLFSGSHYDLLVRNIPGDEDILEDISVFSTNDQFAFEGAMCIVKDLHRAHKFEDSGEFPEVCFECRKQFRGKQEYQEHHQKTGHF